LYAYDSPGEDDLDEICKMHDLGYDTHGRDSLEVDKKLVENLKALDSDPRKWSKPPATKEDMEYARDYILLMRLYFSGKINKKELEDWLQSPPANTVPPII